MCAPRVQLQVDEQALYGKLAKIARSLVIWIESPCLSNLHANLCLENADVRCVLRLIGKQTLGFDRGIRCKTAINGFLTNDVADANSETSK